MGVIGKGPCGWLCCLCAFCADVGRGSESQMSQRSGIAAKRRTDGMFPMVIPIEDCAELITHWAIPIEDCTELNTH
eukprot:3297220-Rhodomonas_salina.5